MILCLDLGNTQVYGGLFQSEKLVLQFRKNRREGLSSDEWGLFLRDVLRENGCDPKEVQFISIGSVVPGAIYSLTRGCFKYFGINPFLLKPGCRTGLKIAYKNPLELGADRIANAIAATHFFPNKNIILIDLGTATTACAISKDKTFIGGCILLGLKASMIALEASAVKLPSVEIKKPKTSVGRSTEEGIQSGLYYGALGAIKEIKKRMIAEIFFKEPVMTIGTGGFSHLFKEEGVFDHHEAHLVLHGLYQSLKMNC